MTDDEDDELTPQEEAQQHIIDNQIMFVLQLLLNDYEAEDIARVAQDLLDLYKSQFLCVDCEESVTDKGEFFLVHDELLQEVELEEGLLCVSCFEKRLGRELQYFDFTSAMVTSSREINKSELLAKRLINGLAETLPQE